MEDNSVENGGVRFVQENHETVEEDVETIKERIMEHPVYGVLIESHKNCLKVALGRIGEVGATTSLEQGNVKLSSTDPSLSDLDPFMEEYCMALGKLKEAMEKPIQEAESFINGMYAQLSELSGTNPTTEKSTCNLASTLVLP